MKSIKKTLVIGLGLIGGSLALALRKAGLGGTIIGCDRDQDEVDLAIQIGMIDQGSTQAEDWIADADLIVVSVPVIAMESVMAQLKPLLRRDTLVTDVGSSKGSVLESAIKIWGQLPENFVLGHPIAGSEKSGVSAALVDLYQKHKVILTPAPENNPQAVTTITEMWQAAGAEVLTMDIERHDEVLAATSHLPHMLAFSLVDTLASQDESLEIFRYAAGGFRDFTRIAASDPVMWRDIYIANKPAVLQALTEFEQGLSRLRTAIEESDSDAMLGIFTRAKAAREHFSRILDNSAYIPMQNKLIHYRTAPGTALSGRIRVPGDKSISHRSIMLGSLAEGVTHVKGFLEGEDSLATLQAFRDMGVVIEGPHQGEVTIHGVGLNGLKKPAGALYLGNSGTSMRLLAGLLAGQAFDVELTGDASLTKRPMERVAKPLREMGAVVETAEGGRPPMLIRGGQQLKGIDYQMPMASAQVKSCVLLAGLYADGETKTTEPAPTRDHTERMLTGFGYEVVREGATAALQGGGKLTASDIDVPSDISSAAFFMVAGSIADRSEILIEHVGMNPTRVGILNILREMGADITLENESEVGGEPVADVRVRSADLKGIDIPQDQVPLAIDEFPVLFVAAACAEGVTRLRGAEELRVKESDRIQVMADGLLALGIECTVYDDGIDIVGGKLGGGRVHSHDDHRIAMSFAVASLRAEGEIFIEDCANVATSFPGFVELANGVGMNISVEEA
ncbi:bifunctional prephenate dehydrogenase/3-phosphoshikimate 1-carboxyvinyltransferase [Oceanospirillum sanctuarii]|uniref:bifunctional prephenate dehydrogenase/3-phosphoshikimate 1-carboxyvinyltransferase n=1 Tax=Oceanospirillum sanctuarii TaxID=1434821 RepID=UPI000A3CC640|nr:bifunctional prephenate dehydrogenase/3-phosphoshikimate 1-carboxyvinyltransferase [Oceanospirillum sanctuarii]